MINLPKPYQELQIQAPDGRAIMVARWGLPGGKPVLSHHGTPMSRLDPPDPDLLDRFGIDLVMYDRAGYGRSSRDFGRSVGAAAADAAAVADAVGIERFAVHGISGGGPHALACAALLGDRVVRTACVVGVGPVGVTGFDPFDGMNDLSVAEFEVAAQGREAMERYVAEYVELTSAEGGAVMDAWMDELPEPDRRAYGSPLGRAMSDRALQEAMAVSGSGWVDDGLAFVAPWGFDLAGIATPVSIWAGELDRLVPVQHARYMAAQIPGAELHVVPDRGHELDHEPIFEWLTT